MNTASQEKVESPSNENSDDGPSVEEILFANIELPQKPLTNQKFKQDTGLYINWLDKLSDQEKWQAYIFLSQTNSGRKLAKNAAEKYKERITVNQGLGKELADTKRRLKEFLNIHNSEIFSAGKWLLSALSKIGEERDKKLLEKDLVHKENYNDVVVSAQHLQKQSNKGKQQSIYTISNLEQRIDTLRKTLQDKEKTLKNVEDIIVTELGIDTWESIVKRMEER